VIASLPCADSGAARSRRCARIEVQAHAVRLRPDPQGLLTLDSGTPGQARWDAVEYGEEVGGRLVGVVPRDGRELRIALTWWGSWKDERAVSGTVASTATPGAPLNITNTDLGLREEAGLGDLDVTSSRTWFCAPSLDVRWGWGGRFLRLTEEAAFLFPTTVPVANAAVFQADLASTLVAAEVCAAATLRLGGRLEIETRGALFAGWMRRSARLATVNIQPPPSEPSGHRDDLGYGAEAEVALRWRATPRWSVSVGYGVLLLGPVSRGHEAYDFSDVATSDLGPRFSDDTLVVHRLFVGLGVDL
jgi:hypothetical protein